MAKKQISKSGAAKLREELDYLVTVRRAEMAQKLKEARAQGDLSENAEYDEAKNEQAIMEAQIMEIQYTLDNSEIVDDNVRVCFGKLFKAGVHGLASAWLQRSRGVAAGGNRGDHDGHPAAVCTQCFDNFLDIGDRVGRIAVGGQIITTDAEEYHLGIEGDDVVRKTEQYPA